MVHKFDIDDEGSENPPQKTNTLSQSTSDVDCLISQWYMRFSEPKIVEKTLDMRYWALPMIKR